jgi:hypothetical protein
MQPPNQLSRFLFAGIIPKPKKAVPEQELLPLNLLPSLDVFPKNHPTLDSFGPQRTTQDTSMIIFNLNADFQARKMTLQALLKMMNEYKFDLSVTPVETLNGTNWSNMKNNVHVLVQHERSEVAIFQKQLIGKSRRPIVILPTVKYIIFIFIFFAR